MGFLSAFAKLGSVGSTTHWTNHIYSFIGRVR